MHVMCDTFSVTKFVVCTLCDTSAIVHRLYIGQDNGGKTGTSSPSFKEHWTRGNAHVYTYM